VHSHIVSDEHRGNIDAPIATRNPYLAVAGAVRRPVDYSNRAACLFNARGRAKLAPVRAAVEVHGLLSELLERLEKITPRLPPTIRVRAREPPDIDDVRVWRRPAVGIRRQVRKVHASTPSHETGRQ